MSEMAPETPPHDLCRCGRPTRDHAPVCDTCADNLTQALSELPWLTTELNVTLTGTKGVDYRRSGGTPSSEPRLPIHVAASELLTDIRATLTSWVKFCADEHIRHQSPKLGLPADSIQAMSGWLLWRVDGLAFHDIGPDAVEEITVLVVKGKRLVDRPADKWYAGPCDQNECGADLYARSTVGNVKCAECGATYDIGERRTWLLEAAEDRLATAADLARAVSWLGAAPLTSDRVRKWAERGRILAHGHDGRYPLYRVGDAINLLADTTKAG